MADLRKLLMMDYATKNPTGLLKTGGQANMGLLGGNINPNLLIGAGIISGGLRGQDPFTAAFPAITQGVQTSALLDQLNRSRKTKEFVDKYKKDLPEGSTLKTLFELNPDKALDFISKSELAKLNAQNKRTTAVKNAIAIGLEPGSKEFNDFIKAQTVKTDVAAQALQQAGGSVISPGKRDEIVKDVRYVSGIRDQLGSVIKTIKDDPTLLGGVGSLRRGANKIGTLFKDVGIDVKQFLPEGVTKEFVFDPDIPTITALENTIAAGYAKVLFPGQKITNLQIQQAKEVVALTGFTGSDEVINRLQQVDREMNNFVNSYQNLLEMENNVPKKFRFNPNTNQLEEF